MTTTTLTADQSDDDVEASVAAAGPRESDFLIQIGDEYQYVEWRGDQFAHPWQVKRGFLGTLPVAHSSGAAVTVEPEIGGGGGAATLAAVLAEGNDTGGVGIVSAPAGGESATATITVTGSAVDAFHRGNADASIAATTHGDPSFPSTARVNRTATATGPSDAFADTTVSVADGDGHANTDVTVAGIQDANAKTTATTAGGNADVSLTANVTDADGGDAFADASANSVDGKARTRRSATSTNYRAEADTFADSGDGAYAHANTLANAMASDGGGEAQVQHWSLTDGSGVATVELKADWRLGGTPTNVTSIKVVADSTSARIGFFDATPVAKPTGVAVTPEAIHAALVSLGIIAA